MSQTIDDDVEISPEQIRKLVLARLRHHGPSDPLGVTVDLLIGLETTFVDGSGEDYGVFHALDDLEKKNLVGYTPVAETTDLDKETLDRCPEIARTYFAMPKMPKSFWTIRHRVKKYLRI